MASTQKTEHKAPSLDPRFGALVRLLAEVRIRIIREAGAQQRAKQQ
jgi:hypothetical protein